MARRARLDVFLRLSAALVGTVPVALYASLVLASFTPASDEVRAAVGIYAPLPLYTLFACLAARARGGVRAWAACVVATGLLNLGLLVH